MRQRGAALNRLHDILEHVPAAFERLKLVDRLTKLRQERGDFFRVWGCGLSNTEVAWQIYTREKYNNVGIPDQEVAAHKAIIASEEPAARKHSAEVLEYMKPPYPEQ